MGLPAIAGGFLFTCTTKNRRRVLGFLTFFTNRFFWRKRLYFLRSLSYNTDNNFFKGGTERPTRTIVSQDIPAPCSLAGLRQDFFLARKEGMRLYSVVMDAIGMDRALMRIAHEIIERNESTQDLCIVGIKRRGEQLSQIIAQNLEKLGAAVKTGTLDITRYRDDIESDATLNEVQLPFDVRNQIVIIVDDVLYTGRTVRAAIDAILAHGRPAKIQLAVLVDRGHRELPIRADYVGKNIPTSREERIHVQIPPFEETACVTIEKQ